jgi:chemotaxis regulatin CheY-phosphate phosphatase CheZ
MWKKLDVSDKEVFKEVKRKAAKRRWNREKLNRVTQQTGLYTWSIDEFLREFCLDSNFEDYREMIKSMKRMLRKTIRRGRWAIDEDLDQVVIVIDTEGPQYEDMLEYLKEKRGEE